MLKKLFRFSVIVLMFVGIFFGLNVTIRRLFPSIEKQEAEANIFNKIQSTSIALTNFYTYGRAFNVSGKIPNISKDNFESVRLVITDGLEFEESYNLNYEFSENDLVFSSSEKINSGIILDKLENSKYYILLRLKVNNSVNPKYYSFSNGSDNEELTYYSVTQDGNNKKAEILFLTKEFAENEYTVLTIEVSDAKLPEDVYDIVIDAGHGGKDAGEKQGDITEADITLDYAKTLKTSLEAQGFKVKLTRDDNNTDSFTYNDMYDEDGRISLACSSKAKLMISLHLNNGINDLNGFEIYAPCKSNLDFAEQMAKCIKNNTSINFSNNKSFKEKEGVYLRNFTKNEIKASSDTSKSKGFEPYLITTDTPYLYTIREVGGVATGAYADGRNTAYSKNKYYDSNQGIECYQLELGYIKTDLNTILDEKENYIDAITEAILNYTK